MISSQPGWQGLLDFKFLNDRFQRGKTALENFMDKKHRLVSVQSLVTAHPTIVQMQADMGNSGFLGI